MIEVGDSFTISTVAPMCQNFYRILNYFTKVFTLGVLFFKKQVSFKKFAT